MPLRKSIIAYLSLFLTCATAQTIEIFNEKESGSIKLLRDGQETVYENITGNSYGISKGLTSINNTPALFLLDRDTYYYTLKAGRNGLLIDCAYSDTRNQNNGARVSAAICGINAALGKSYDEIGRAYSDEWQASLFSFDTSQVIKGGFSANFPLGRIGEVDIYDRYSSLEALENASPQKHIKSALGCFDFGNSLVFLVFLKEENSRLRYLDVVQSHDPKIFKRLDENDLIRIAVESCE
ncbi:hypothetical protein AABC73_21300 [Pseudomonas sp. G.S.17]|uniref:hypothetical protein n=1 Tax=Pseudomonas sp. G.S.17 TaxID=3137451 RepID=UPI00311CBE6D